MKEAILDILVVSFKMLVVFGCCAVISAFTGESTERLVVGFTLLDLYLYKREVARK